MTSSTLKQAFLARTGEMRIDVEVLSRLRNKAEKKSGIPRAAKAITGETVFILHE